MMVVYQGLRTGMIEEMIVKGCKLAVISSGNLTPSIMLIVNKILLYTSELIRVDLNFLTKNKNYKNKN